MPQVTSCKLKWSGPLFLAIIVVIAIAGCSDPNTASTLNPDTGNHPAGWYIDHRIAFLKDQAVCTECHGADLRGGVSGVSCYSASFGGMSCHANGPVGHPAGWSDPSQHGVAAEQDFSACKICHGATYKGGLVTTTCYQCHNGPGLNHPAPAWVVADHKTAALTDNTVCQKCHGTNYLGGGSHIACNSCHMENQTKVHRLAWYPDVQLNHRAYALANGTSSCANQYCHGTNLTGVANSGPSCSTCHTWPFTEGACGTCHAIPPAGTTFPDTAGRHAIHTGLGSYITCDTCHTGAGSGTANHQNSTADVNIAATYNGNAGAATYTAASFSCTNVSCHGGPRTQTSTQAQSRTSTLVQTPSWLTGAITVNTQCTSCHVLGSSAGNPEDNSYYSGRHYLHVYQQSIACTTCHNTTSLAVNHFTNLDTPAMEGPASATLNTALQYNGTSCNPSAGGLSGCHGSQNW